MGIGIAPSIGARRDNCHLKKKHIHVHCYTETDEEEERVVVIGRNLYF